VRLFTEHELDDDGRRITVREGGRVFDPGRREAVIGSFAARQLGLSVGDVFNTYHGLSYNPRERHENDSFTVVGILDPTNTPMDRVLWIPLEGYFRMSGHVLQGAGAPYRPEAGASIPDEHKEVSGVLLTLRQQGFSLSQQINRQGNVATLAWPVSRVIAELFERMGWLNRVLEIIAYLVVLVAAGSILASVYNTMNERRREFAILRALGARKRTVFGAIVIESAAIALLGTLLGYVIYLGLMTGTATILRTQVGVVLEVTQWHPGLLLTPIGMTIVGAAAGILPAVKAYGTDVAANLIPQS
ncbi:MAG: ABC transporter permease, partial [Phycisphaeraceae bacterium]